MPNFHHKLQYVLSENDLTGEQPAEPDGLPIESQAPTAEQPKMPNEFDEDMITLMCDTIAMPLQLKLWEPAEFREFMVKMVDYTLAHLKYEGFIDEHHGMITIDEY